MLLVVWAAVTVIFFTVKLIPGDPVDIILGPLATITEASKARIREELGLNEPVLIQYFDYLAALITGNFGSSYQLNQPVIEVLTRALGPTSALTGLALLIAGIFVLCGVLLARTPLLRVSIEQTHVLATSVPTFWLGYLLLFVFAFTLRWLPATGGTGLQSLWLPALALAVPVAGVIGQVLLAGIQDTYRRPFWLTVRARGVSQLRFDARHGFRHGLSNVTPLTAQIIGGLLGGTVIVEQVFSRPGIGSVALVAITNRDMPVILGIVALSAAIFALLSLLAEGAVWLIDPRTRTEAIGAGQLSVREEGASQ